MKIIKIDRNNQVNGDGLRCVVWVSGCDHHCKNCHNPETWDYNCGHNLSNEDMLLIFKQLSSPEISGVTITGGDPFAPRNRHEVAQLCSTIKEFFPEKTIWIYTGYTYEELPTNLLKDVDILIDGEYVESLNPGIGKLKWRGSSNQRIIDIKNSNPYKITEYEDIK